MMIAAPIARICANRQLERPFVNSNFETMPFTEQSTGTIPVTKPSSDTEQKPQQENKQKPESIVIQMPAQQQEQPLANAPYTAEATIETPAQPTPTEPAQNTIIPPSAPEQFNPIQPSEPTQRLKDTPVYLRPGLTVGLTNNKKRKHEEGYNVLVRHQGKFMKLPTRTQRLLGNHHPTHRTKQITKLQSIVTGKQIGRASRRERV